MQRLIMLVVVFALNLHAESGIIKSLQSQFENNSTQRAKIQSILQKHGINFEVLEVHNLTHGLSFVVVGDKEGHKNSLFSTNDGEVIFHTQAVFSLDRAFDTKLETLHQELYEEQRKRVDSQVLEIFKNYTDAVISFKAKTASKKTFYIVSDPNCPYCHKELERLPILLEDANVKMLVVGFLGENSLQKASVILEKRGADEKANLVLLQQLYTKDKKQNLSYQKKQLEKALQITRALSDSGINGVPYIIERDN